jgi:hypothetical protein
MAQNVPGGFFLVRETPDTTGIGQANRFSPTFGGFYEKFYFTYF